ncbi:CCR4-Not complex component, Not1-domain-containing protein [Chytriomyces sp. MP71]|nr:CCR4-Not complex component, Not1-domain-containing protein [Chytriomyces sp. MP71]
MQAGSLVRELGPSFTSSLTACRTVLDALGLSGPAQLSEGIAARLVAAMAISSEPGNQAGIHAILKDRADQEALSAARWDTNLFVAAVMERNPSLDWFSVMRYLDHKEFAIYDTQGLSVVINAFKAAVKDIFKFPIQAFLGPWQNPKSQLSFLKHALFSAPELFSFPLQLGNARRVLSDQILMGKQVPAALSNLPWNNLDLLETLVTLSETTGVEGLEDVKGLFDVAVQQSAEIVLIGLAQIPPPWTPLQKEVASALVIMFLAGNNSSAGFVISILWQIAPSLVLAGLMHLYNKDPATHLGRILDIVQEVKALQQILDAKHVFFALDLAVLAFRRGYMNMEKWLLERIAMDRANGQNAFLKASLEFVSEKVGVAVAANLGQPGAGQAGIMPAEIVALFLRILRTSPMTPEMTAYFKELVAVTVKVYPQLRPGSASPDDLASQLIAGTNPATSAEAQANLYYSKILKGEVSIPQIVELLRRYRDSANPREQDVFAVFTQVHLDEYKFFPQYPDRHLQITSMLFGALIQDVYVDPKNVANSLRCVLEALRQPVGSKYFVFGTVALAQFQARLGEWPHYCALLLQIPHLVQSNPEIVNYITPLATVQDGASATATASSASESTAAVASGESASGAASAGADGKGDEKPVFTALRLDTLLEAGDQEAYEEPDETTKDKILFNINNLTFDNLESKSTEMKETLKDVHFRWFSQYLVVKRASIEPNYHELYLSLLETLKHPTLMRNILHETYANIKVLLNSDKTVTSSSERTLLKNLGTWLGSLTLAKNKPIKHKNLAFKELLMEGFESDRLIVVLPFACKVLEQCHDSKAFKPPNPWLMAIMKLLSELYHFADLKLNLKFEIEVLCKKIQLDIKDIDPSIILRNRPSKMSAQKKVGVDSASPTPDDSLYPIAMHITLPNLPIFNLQPAMKRIVHIAIDRAIREVIVSPVVERSVTIAGIATRELIVKDFALEPNEEKMRKAAHLMAQNLAGSLAIVSSRDPLRVGMITQLQNLLRQNGITEQAVPEAVVFSIVNDNLDLACTVMERAAADKSVAEIDETLAPAYLNRRKHRERSSQPFYDVNVYAASRYPSSLPEPLRLKPNGLTASQLRVYEDFSRISRTAPSSSAAEVTDRELKSREPSMLQMEDVIPAVITQAVEKLESHVSELEKVVSVCISTSISQLPAQHDVKVALRAISQFMNSFNREDVLLLTGQKIVGQLYKVDTPLSFECYVLLLERIFELSKRAAKEVISWFLFSKDERRLSIPVLVIMIRANMLPIIDLDIQLARMIDAGQPGMVDLVVTLLREVLLGETPFVAYDAFFNCTMMLSERAEEDESAISLLSDIKSRFSIISLKKAGKDLESDELRESLGILFSEWVKLYHHPSSSEKTHKAFVIRLQDLGVLHDEDISSMFFRVCTELSVDLYIQAKSTSNVSPYTPFQAADAFSRLIVLLVRYCVEPDGAPGNSAKLDLTTKILYIIVLVLVHSHEQGRSQFNQRPFFRLFSSLLYDLNLFEDQLSNVYYQILFKISNTLHTLQPSFLPGFTLSWLQLISHRYFMAKLLAAESQKGWPFFQRLLVDLFKFLGPFLRQTEMADAIRLLYKATLRILLVLLHDFPEFLCDYHFSFVEVIPHSCIQLRNLILSAFPRNMRLPDPFTPNLKVDLLPEINQSPHVMSDFTSPLTALNLKAELDAYLKHRSPPTFINGLRNRLLLASPQQDDVSKYNMAAINSLVLYVGVQAIAQAQAKGTQPSAPLTPSAPMDIFQHLTTEMDSEGRYLLLSAIANQLRYPNSHTHYFSCVLLYLFAESTEEIIQEQITRVLIERLIVNRPHPYGLLITFIELIRNQRYNFWEHTNFIRCAPEIERLFSSVAKSIQSSMMRT